MERYREGPAAARLSGGRGIAIRAPAMGAGLGLSTGDVPFPVMVIPTRNAFRVVPAKTSVAFSTQRITTNLRMLSLLGGDRLSETVAVLYRDGTVLSADRRAIATFAQAQQERGHGAPRLLRWPPARSGREVRGRRRYTCRLRGCVPVPRVPALRVTHASSYGITAQLFGANGSKVGLEVLVQTHQATT